MYYTKHYNFFPYGITDILSGRLSKEDFEHQADKVSFYGQSWEIYTVYFILTDF